MPTKIGELGITFPNGTVQTTAGSGHTRGSQTFFASNTAWVIPTNVTVIKVSLIGGGGGGGAGYGYDDDPAGQGLGGGGGGGGFTTVYYYGLTPGLTLNITVGAGGIAGNSTNAPGGNGGNSQIASGSQSITTVVAPGGAGGGYGQMGVVVGAGGTGGQISTTSGLYQNGQSGTGWSPTGGGLVGGQGGNSAYGFGARYLGEAVNNTGNFGAGGSGAGPPSIFAFFFLTHHQEKK